MKKILLIFGATSSLFTQEYDPYTGKPIRLPTKNIFTGQIQENETIPTVKLVKVELKSEETVSGELIQEKNTFIIIKNEVLGILQIEKNKIAEMYESAGADYSVKKANSTKSAAASARNSAHKNKKNFKKQYQQYSMLEVFEFLKNSVALLLIGMFFFRRISPLKKILPIIIISALIGQDRYDPLTGERIPNKKFDPNTGEIIEEKYDPYTGDVIKKDSDGLTAKVILRSGDIIEGKLIIQDKNKVTIDSEILGKVSINRIDIKSMTSGGIPKSTRRVAKTPTIKTDNSNTDLSNNGFEIFSNAKNEAQKSNSQILNLAVGTGACLNPAFFATLPVMGLAIYANVNVKEPKSEFYKNLNGDQKKQFTKVYKKEIRRLRTEQCFTPTGLVLGFFGLMIFLG